MKRNFSFYFPLACFLGLLQLSGCGPEVDNLPRTVNASGVVTLNGSPVEGASIVFVDVNGVYSASSSSDSRGRFSLNAFEAKTGAVPGSYKVMVSKTIELADPLVPDKNAPEEEAEHAAEMGPDLVYWENSLPQKYASIGSSGLAVDIPEDGISDIKLELTE